MSTTHPLSLIEQIALATGKRELLNLLFQVTDSSSLTQEDLRTNTAALSTTMAVKILPALTLLKQFDTDRVLLEVLASALTVDELVDFGVEPSLANVGLFGILFLRDLRNRLSKGGRLHRVKMTRGVHDPLGDWQMDDLRVPDVS